MKTVKTKPGAQRPEWGGIWTNLETFGSLLLLLFPSLPAEFYLQFNLLGIFAPSRSLMSERRIMWTNAMAQPCMSAPDWHSCLDRGKPPPALSSLRPLQKSLWNPLTAVEWVKWVITQLPFAQSEEDHLYLSSDLMSGSFAEKLEA